MKHKQSVFSVVLARCIIVNVFDSAIPSQFACHRFRGFDHGDLEVILEEAVNYPACNSKVPVLLTTFDFSRNSPVLFSTKGASRFLLPTNTIASADHQLRPDIKMAKLCRASAAAPTMFVPKKVSTSQYCYSQALQIIDSP